MQENTGKLMLNVIRFTDQVTPDGLPMMRQSYSKDIFYGAKALESLIVGKVKAVVSQPVYEEINVKDGEDVPSGAIPVSDGEVIDGVTKYKKITGRFEEMKLPVNGEVPPNSRPLREDWSEVETIDKEQITKSMLNALRVLWKDREEMPSWATIEAIEELKEIIA